MSEQGNPVLQAHAAEAFKGILEATAAIAATVYAYREQLVKAGFTKGEALVLASAFQATILQSRAHPGEGSKIRLVR